jgi:hypothetical protein
MAARKPDNEPREGSNRTEKATLEWMPQSTGRDGAIDYAGKSESVAAGNGAPDPARLTQALGAAVIECWGDLSKQDQERIFERAVVLGHRSERDEMLREQLAKFLHDHHKRTEASRGDAAATRSRP